MMACFASEGFCLVPLEFIDEQSCLEIKAFGHVKQNFWSCEVYIGTGPLVVTSLAPSPTQLRKPAHLSWRTP